MKSGSAYPGLCEHYLFVRILLLKSRGDANTVLALATECPPSLEERQT